MGLACLIAPLQREDELESTLTLLLRELPLSVSECGHC
jgi:hypothetical protein